MLTHSDPASQAQTTRSPKKLAFFVTAKNLDNLDLDALDGIELIAIFGESERGCLTDAIKQRFAETHIVGEVLDPDSLITIPQKYAVKDIVQRRLTREQMQPADAAMICSFEGALMSIAEIREELGIPGTLPKDVVPYRDKAAMKEAVARADLRVPKFGLLDWSKTQGDVKGTFLDNQCNFGTPFIAKPVNSSGTRGVVRISDLADFEALVKVDRSATTYEVEEFIVGTLYTCDFLVTDGRITFTGVSRYITPMLDYLSGATAGSIALSPDDDAYRAIAAFGEQCLRAMGLFDSCFHLEIFSDAAGDLVFLEAAARAPGFQVTRMYDVVFGVSMLNEELRCSLGLPAAHTPPVLENGSAFWAIVPLKSGTVARLREPDLHSRVERVWFVDVGDTVTKSAANKDRALELLGWHKEKTVVDRDFESLRSYVAVDYVGDVASDP